MLGEVGDLDHTGHGTVVRDRASPQGDRRGPVVHVKGMRG